MTTTLAYADTSIAGCFPRARFYFPAPSPDVHAARERGGRARNYPYSERHLQCAWYDAALRPAQLRTADGETAVVEDPGVWNLEAGPDFLGAAIRLGPDQRRITGDVEIHIHPSDWRSHGHRADPRYDRVRIHVTFFPGRLDDSELPPGSVQIALKDSLATNPAFSFENIDLAAYPFAARAATPPCLVELKRWNADDRGLLLDAAGEERLRRKAERLAIRIDQDGCDQVVYEEVMCALGYKQNKTPVRHLAVQVPLDALRRESGGDPVTAYALLIGVAGLMPSDISRRWDAETRAFVRAAWDAWWKLRDRWQPRALPASAWQLGGIRPANHPVRRLMAAAHLFIRSDIAPAQLASVEDGYWSFRMSLGGKKLAAPFALVGQDRADAIRINVALPLAAARGEKETVARELAGEIPAGQDNAIVRQTAFNLFGMDHSPRLYRSGLRRQGLIQIFHDYCMNDRSRCATCTMPELLRAHRGLTPNM